MQQRLFNGKTALIVVLCVMCGAGAKQAPAADAQSPARDRVRILREIPYAGGGAGKVPRNRTLDLYLPPASTTKPPLVIFIHGVLWKLSDNEERVGDSFAAELVERGIAVGLVRYRPGPQHRHPAQAQDAAAAVAYLIKEADRYRYDRKRIFLAGHSAGGHLASLLALDASYLAAHGVQPASLAGVVSISGIYDLVDEAELTAEQKTAVERTFGRDAAGRKAASPVEHIRKGAPPFLILSGSSDSPGLSIDARRFAETLRAKGGQDAIPLVVSGRDHFSIVRLAGEENPVRELLLDFLKIQPMPLPLKELIQAKREWLKAPFSTLAFWGHKDLIRSYPLDQRLLLRLIAVYGPLRHELVQWPLREFHAIDLFSYLETLPEDKVGKGDYLVITNARNEKQFWSRRQIEPYQPVIVVGIDDQRDLFQMTIFSRMSREYSWKPSPQPPGMARPVGAFVHFLKQPPDDLGPRSWHHALTEDSFKLEKEDALAAFKNLPKGVYEALTHRNGCVYCHSFQGIGSRSHHTLISSGAAHGGFALPLEEYPPEVWKAFVFQQEEVADKMGATPNVVDESAREYLYNLVVKSRANPKPR
jgi:acetyl esterase/lipase